MFLIESEAHCECLKLRMLLLRITVATMDDWGLNYMCIFNLYPLLSMWNRLFDSMEKQEYFVGSIHLIMQCIGLNQYIQRETMLECCAQTLDVNNHGCIA